MLIKEERVLCQKWKYNIIGTIRTVNKTEIVMREFYYIVLNK